MEWLDLKKISIPSFVRYHDYTALYWNLMYHECMEKSNGTVQTASQSRAYLRHADGECGKNELLT